MNPFDRWLKETGRTIGSFTEEVSIDPKSATKLNKGETVNFRITDLVRIAKKCPDFPFIEIYPDLKFLVKQDRKK